MEGEGGGERGGEWEERKEEEALDCYIYNVSMRVRREGEGRGEAWMGGGREEEGAKGGGGGRKGRRSRRRRHWTVPRCEHTS